MNINQNLNDLMKEAQKMQERMQDAQEQLKRLKVIGKSGGGMVTVEMNGSHEVSAVKLHNSLLDDVEMLEDLIAAAFNDAAHLVEKASKEKISQLTAGLKIPTEFGGQDEREE